MKRLLLLFALLLIMGVLACDPELGVGLPPEQVFGLRFVPGEHLVAEYDPTYVQPIKTGKVTCINTLMAPLHGGTGPVLVGGDSNGDVAMLTSFNRISPLSAGAQKGAESNQ